MLVVYFTLPPMTANSCLYLDVNWVTKICYFCKKLNLKLKNKKQHVCRLQEWPYIHTCWCGVTNWNIQRPSRTANSSNFGLLEEQSSPKWEIPCLVHWWTTVQNLTPLAFSSVDKSSTVQTHTNKQWSIYPHLAYRHVWITIICIFCTSSLQCIAELDWCL